jgi:hypothetical protein
MPTAARVRGFALSLSILVLAGCISTTFRPSQDARTEPEERIAPEKVRVLRSFPDEPFLLLGEIEANMSGHHKDEAIIRKARQKAAAIGADAIVYDSAGLVTPVYGSDPPGSSPAKRASVRFAAVRLLPMSTPTRFPLERN